MDATSGLDCHVLYCDIVVARLVLAQAEHLTTCWQGMLWQLLVVNNNDSSS